MAEYLNIGKRAELNVFCHFLDILPHYGGKISSVVDQSDVIQRIIVMMCVCVSAAARQVSVSPGHGRCPLRDGLGRMSL